MLDETELIARLEDKLDRATKSRTRIRKQVDAGYGHESHLAYADGLVDGIESAILSVVARVGKLDAVTLDAGKDDR